MFFIFLITYLVKPVVLYTSCYSKNFISTFNQKNVLNQDTLMCYVIMHLYNMDYNNSKEFCVNEVHETAKLTTIRSEEENGFVFSNIQDNVLIGIKHVDGVWYEIDEKTHLGYTNWDVPPDPETFGNCAYMSGGNGEWRCVPCDLLRSPVCSYSTNYTCNNILSTEEGVCNSRGRCRTKDDCVCDHGYDGNDCQFYLCDEISSFYTDLVCGNGNGNCVSIDECVCTKEDTYGKYCQETIHNGTLLLKTNIVKIPYVVSVELLTGDYYIEDSNVVYFDCLDILNFPNESVVRYNQEEGACYFEYDKKRENTKNLIVDLKIEPSDRFTVNGSNIVNIPYVLINPITFYENENYVRIYLDVIQVDDEDNNNNDDDDDDENNNNVIIEGDNGVTTTIVISVVILSVIFFVVIIVVSIFIIIVCTLYSRELKKRKNEQELNLLEVDKIVDDFMKEVTIPEFKVNDKMFEIKFNEMKIKKMIGQGGMGKVFLANWNRIKVAFKVFEISDDNIYNKESDFEDFEKELNIINSLSHPNIIKFYGFCFCKNRIGMVIEYCENGDLFNYAKNRKWDFSKTVILNCLWQISLAMVYLHSKKIIHRDLKLDNILVSKDFDMKICDFGTSKIKSNKTQKHTVRIGTTIYMAPEVVSIDTKYTEKCDVFSFSIIVCQLMKKQYNVYDDARLYGLEHRVSRDENFRPNIDNLCYNIEPLKDLMTRCWSHNPERRHTFEEVCEILEAEKNKI